MLFQSNPTLLVKKVEELIAGKCYCAAILTYSTESIDGLNLSIIYV